MPKKKIFELEKQLHEQYAINNNSNLSSIIALMTALLIIFGVYGYVFIHTNIAFADNWGNLIAETKCDKAIYYLDVLVLATISTYYVVIILYYIANYIGTNQRKEQFITYAIRRKYYLYNNEDFNAVYPDGYHPFEKTILNFVQGLYGEISKILMITFYLISILSVTKIAFNIYEYQDGSINWKNFLLFLITFLLTLSSFCYIKRSLYQNYRARQIDFLKKNIYQNNQYEETINMCCLRIWCIKLCKLLWKILNKKQKLNVK